MTGTPLFSCLCVTEGRPQFMPWLLWSFDRQTLDSKELVIVDSSAEPFRTNREDVRVISSPSISSIPAKRNLALEAARGSFVTWFDDDDWQHPARLERLLPVLRGESPFAGPTRSWFLDVFSERGQPYFGHRAIIFNGAGFHADLAKAVRFDERVHKASDTVWMREMQARHGTRGEVLEGDILTLWLCHDANISNPRTRRRLTTSRDELKAILGPAWGDTDARLAALREQLPEPLEPELPWHRGGGAGRDSRASQAANRHVQRVLGRARRLREAPPDQATQSPLPDVSESTEKTAGSGRARSEPSLGDTRGQRGRPALAAIPIRKLRGQPAVSLVLRATPHDLPYLELLLRHVEAQARHSFAERLVVIEPGQGGLSAAATLEGTRERLVAGKVADQVLVPWESATLEAAQPYFRDGGPRPDSPTASRTLAELAGLSVAASDYVLLVGSGVLFYTSGRSWVADALARMRSEPRIWLMKTQGGPPAGPVGHLRSLPREDAGHFHWDARLSVWRSRRAPGEYYLVDRRKLLAALRPLDAPAACLGDWIADAMRRNGGQSGSLGGKGTWAIHAKGTRSFPGWPGALSALVEQGVFPSSQRGQFRVDLDDPETLFEWLRLSEASGTRRQA